MDEANKMIPIIVGVIVAVILIGVVFAIISFSNNAKENAMEDLAAGIGQMDQTKFEPYDNSEQSGSVLSSALVSFKGQPTAIVIKTKAGEQVNYLAALEGLPSDPGADEQYVTAELKEDWDSAENYNVNFKDTKKAASKNFIKPTARYQCWLIKNANEETIGFYAVQK